MIAKIFRQIWNERRLNVWLFLELFIVSLAVWLAIDPLAELISRDSIDPNFDERNVYKLEMARRLPGKHRYNAALDNDSLVAEQYLQLINIIEGLPEIESYALTSGVPGNGMMRDEFVIDSTQNIENISVKKRIRYIYNYSTGRSNVFATFGIKPPAGYDPQNSKARGVYVSRSLMQELYGTNDIIGRTITHEYSGTYPVLGIIDDIQCKMYREPESAMIFNHTLHVRGSSQGFIYRLNPCIRLKKGVDKNRFEEKFRAEIMPKLTAGNIYCRKLTSMTEDKKEYKEIGGAYALYRQNIIFSLFALLCGFMGIAGTFWVRVVERRQTIGIMQSIGATRASVLRQYATEAVILSSIAFVLALAIVLHKLCIDGFANPLNIELVESCYLHAQPFARFVAVTSISYILMIVISVAGAVIPTAATIKRFPANALKE